MRDLQSAANAIVVGNGDKIHTAIAGPTVHVHRFHVTFRSPNAAQKPFAGSVGVLAVDVNIGLGFVRIEHGVLLPSLESKQWTHHNRPAQDFCEHLARTVLEVVFRTQLTGITLAEAAPEWNAPAGLRRAKRL